MTNREDPNALAQKGSHHEGCHTVGNYPGCSISPDFSLRKAGYRRSMHGSRSSCENSRPSPDIRFHLSWRRVTTSDALSSIVH